MANIKIKVDKYKYPNSSDEWYEIDTSRKFEGYESGDILCYIAPFFDIPLTLHLAIRKNGKLIFRGWEWSNSGNSYLHLYEEHNEPVTDEQIDTVNGLFSGRILFEGLKLAVGATLQHICPINVEAEEKRTGKKIFLA